MCQPCLSEPIELKVPAKKENMLVIRLTAAGVIARAGLTVDRLDDVKMAVEEACACLIEAETPPKSLRITFQSEEDGLRIVIRGDLAIGNFDPDEAQVVRCILESLTDGVKMREENGSLASIELRVRSWNG